MPYTIKDLFGETDTQTKNTSIGSYYTTKDLFGETGTSSSSNVQPPAVAPVVLPSEDKGKYGSILGKLVGFAKEKAADALKWLTTKHYDNPIQAFQAGTALGVKSSVDIIKGARTGLLKMLGNISAASDIAKEKILTFGGTIDKDTAKEIVKEQSVTRQLFEKAKKTKEEDTKGISPVRKFIYESAEFTAPQLIPLPIKVPPAIKAGLTFVKDTQLLYNPLEHPVGNELENRLTDATTMFATGVAFHLAPSVVGSIKEKISNVAKPFVEAVTTRMENATRVLTDPFYKRMTEEYAQKISPAILGIDNEFSVKVAPKEIFEVLSGRKPIDDTTRAFFSSPEWKEVVAKYGAKLENYPDFVRVAKTPQPLETIKIPQPIAYLPENIALSRLRSVFEKTAMNLAETNKAYPELMNGKFPFNELETIVSQLEKQGYKVNREKLLDILGKTIQNIRQLDDYNMGILDIEAKKQFLSDIENTGYLKDILAFRKIYNLLKSKTDDLVAIGQSYAKYAKKNNLSQLDEIAEALRNVGFNIEIEDFERGVLDVALGLPTKAELTPPPPPKEFDYKSLLREVVEPFVLKEERPSVVFTTKEAKFENLYKQFQNLTATGKFDEARNLIPEIVKQNPSPFIKRSLEVELEQEIASQTGKEIPIFTKTTVESFGEKTPIGGVTKQEMLSLFGKEAEPDKLNNLIQTFISQIEDKKIPPHQASATFNEILTEYIKRFSANEQKLGEGAGMEMPKSWLAKVRLGLSKILSPFWHTQGYKDIFSNPDARKVYDGLTTWMVLQENLNKTLTKFIEFVSENKFLQENVNEVDKLIREAGVNLFNPAFVSDKFSGEELKIIRDYVSSYREIFRSINILRVAAGKNPIPEFEGYVAPHRLIDAISQALLERTKLKGTEAKIYLERELKEAGLGGIFKDDLVENWNAYARITKRLTSRYTYDFLTQQMGITGSKLDNAAEEILKRWSRSAGASVEKDALSKELRKFQSGLADIFNGFSQLIKEKVLGKKTVERIPITEQMLAEIQQSKTLSMLFPEDVLKKGYIEYDKSLVEKIDRQFSPIKGMLYSLALGWNIPFTIIDLMQPFHTTMPFVGAKSTLRAYTETVLNPLLRVVNLGYDKDSITALGKFYQLIGAGQTVWGDELKHAGTFFKLASLNVELAEENIIRPTSARAFVLNPLIANAPVSPELKERMGIEFSKDVNYVAGKVYSAPLANVPILSYAFMFTQYANNYVGNMIAAMKVALSDKEAVEFFSSIASRAGASPEELVTLAEHIKASRNPDIIAKAVRTLPIFASVGGMLLASYQIGKMLFDAANFVMSQMPFDQLKNNPDYQKTRDSFASAFTERASPLGSIGQLPVVSFASAFKDVASGKPLKVNLPGLTFLYWGYRTITGVPEIVAKMVEGKADEANVLLENMVSDLSSASLAVEVQRLADAWDLYTKGYLVSRTRPGRIQYKPELGETPLTVGLFGRGLTTGYRKLSEVTKRTTEITDLRKEAWDYYERYLETGKQEYYDIFKQKRERLRELGDVISVTDMITHKKQYQKKLTAPERELKPLPKRLRKKITTETEQELGKIKLYKLLGF